WRIPSAADLPAIDPGFAAAPRGAELDVPFLPYARDEHGVRPWAVPGTPGLQHRIGGLEKQNGTGDVSYEGENHELMTHLRAAKVAAIEVPDVEVDDEHGDAALLVLGWGSTEGSIRAGIRRARSGGVSVARAHLRHLNPLPANLGDVLRSYAKVLVPEINTGQLAQVLRAEYLVDVKTLSCVQGRPLYAAEVERRILDELGTP
ncbi:MAG TPA: 2-oxoglutarate ferredoxin oxidoreductase subunit alpha, partial [Solirubrobacteraceae bacterium]